MRKRLIVSVLPLAVILAPLSAVTSACCGSSAAASKASGSGGCSGGGGSQIQSCSRYAEDKNEFGKIAVQQKGPQQPVAWGVYPTDPAGVFKVTITVDDQVYDDKPAQPYPPHGSVKVDPSNKRYLQSGATFSITGTVTRAGDIQEGFYFNCTLA